MVRRAKLNVLEENAIGKDGSHAPALTLDSYTSVEEEQVASLAALGRALSDTIRVRMLRLMAAAAAEGRGCCDPPDLGVPTSVENTEDPGI